MARRVAGRRGAVRILGACDVLHSHRGLSPLPPPYVGRHPQQALANQMGCELVPGTSSDSGAGARSPARERCGALSRVREYEPYGWWLVELEGREGCPDGHAFAR